MGARVSYNGYYVSFPRMRRGSDSLYPHHNFVVLLYITPTQWGCFCGLLHASDATRHPPVVLVEAARAWADAGTVEVQVVDAVATVRRRRPIEPGGIMVVERRTTHAPGIDEVVRIRTKGVRDWSPFCGACVIWVSGTVIVSWICTSI